MAASSSKLRSDMKHLSPALLAASLCAFPDVVYAHGDARRLTTGTCSRTTVAAPGSDLGKLRGTE